MVLVRSTLTVTDTVDVLLGEDAGLVVVGPVARLFDEGGRETVGEGLVVGKLRVDEVVELDNQSGKAKRTKAAKRPTFHAFSRVVGLPKT